MSDVATLPLQNHRNVLCYLVEKVYCLFWHYSTNFKIPGCSEYFIKLHSLPRMRPIRLLTFRINPARSVRVRAPFIVQCCYRFRVLTGILFQSSTLMTFKCTLKLTTPDQIPSFKSPPPPTLYFPP